MKKILFKIAALLALPAVYFIIVSGFKEANITMPGSQASGSNPKDFVNYILASGYKDSSILDPNKMYWNMDNHINSYKELNFNGAHMYGSDSDSLGKFNQSTLLGYQKDNVEDLIDLAGSNNIKSIFDRNRISLLCYSQRLVYEISSNGSNSENYGFAYQDIMQNTFTTDSGRTVLRAQTPATGINSAGWLCKNIYENMQHTDLYYFDPGASDTGKWYVKPEMRIRKEIFDSIPMKDVPVVKINVINFSGDIIDSVILKVKNFGNSNNLYEGNYISNYNFTNDPGVSLEVLGNFTANGLNHGFAAGMTPDSCKVDFQVYWYGLVDVWFDKMIVDDERANILFNPNPLQNYDPWIHDEVESFGDNLIFFADEIVSSNAYTTKYVIDKMIDYNSNSKLQIAISNNLNIHSHRNNSLGSKMLLDIVRPEAICVDAHSVILDPEFGGFIPDVFNDSALDSRIPSQWKRTNSVYNSLLQDKVFGRKDELGLSYQGTFLYQIAQVQNELSELSLQANVLVQPQIQGWMKEENNEFSTTAIREPLNEEIQAQAMIALANGSSGLSWFIYGSFLTSNINTYKFYHIPGSVQSGIYNVFGLRNRYGDNVYGSFTERTRNLYGQDKWNYVKNMNHKILNWKPTLDKIIWQSGYSVHTENANHNFISDI